MRIFNGTFIVLLVLALSMMIGCSGRDNPTEPGVSPGARADLSRWTPDHSCPDSGVLDS
jgi:hypothetical protein